MKNIMLFIGSLLLASTVHAKGGNGGGGGGGGNAPLSPLKVYSFSGVVPPCEDNVFNICDTFTPGLRFKLTYSVDPNAKFDPKFTENYPGAAQNLTLEFIGLTTYTGKRGDILLHSNGLGGTVYYQISMLDLGGGFPIPRFSRAGDQNGVSVYIKFFDHSAAMSSLLGKTLQTADPALDFLKFTDTTMDFLIKGTVGGSGRAGACTQCYVMEMLLTNPN